MELLNGTPTLIILVYLLYGIRVAHLCKEQQDDEQSAYRWIAIVILWIPILIFGTIAGFVRKIRRSS